MEQGGQTFRVDFGSPFSDLVAEPMTQAWISHRRECESEIQARFRSPGGRGASGRPARSAGS
jgi:phage baseplate assembly protein W